MPKRDAFRLTRDERNEMRHPITRQLFQYWNEVRQPRSSPERDEIDPTAIRDILANTFLLETRKNGSFSIRLSGTRVDALWLSDQKNRCFLDLWGADRHAVAAALWTVMDGTNPVVLGTRTAPAGRPPVDAEVLLVPLRHNGKTHSLILGSLSLAQTPPWTGLVAVDTLQLVSMRVITPSDVVDLPFSQTRPHVIPHAIERRAHLTVYAGGR